MPANRGRLAGGVARCTKRKERGRLEPVGFSALADDRKFYVLYPEQRPANNSLALASTWLPANLLPCEGEKLSISRWWNRMKADFSTTPRGSSSPGSLRGPQTATLMAPWPYVCFSPAAR